MAFYNRNELENRGNNYRVFMKRWINVSIKSLEQNKTRQYLDFAKDDFENIMNKHPLVHKFTNRDFKSIHYVDDNVKSSFHGKFFRELQEEYIKMTPPIYLIDESGTNDIFAHEIFVTYDYMPNKKLTHRLNVIESLCNHVQVMESWNIKQMRNMRNIFGCDSTSDDSISNQIISRALNESPESLPSLNELDMDDIGDRTFYNSQCPDIKFEQTISRSLREFDEEIPDLIPIDEEQITDDMSLLEKDDTIN
jgi:hypothetical protein